MDYVYAYLSYYGYKAGLRTMQGFWGEMEKLGKDRNPYRAGFLQFVGVAESRSEAMERYAEAAEYFYGRCLHVDLKYASPPGYNTEATQRVGLESQVKAAAEAAANPAKGKDALGAQGTTGSTTGTRFNMVAKQMEDIVDRGYVIVGSPKDVEEQLRQVAIDMNVGHLMLLLQYGNMSKDLAKYNTKLFADKVAPKLRPLFSEWENKWWPKPMEKAKRAELPAFPPRVQAAE
jgi:alkanesulfonate monooxygenase SsuD/methylene tetrahydromethanopterin reductase-like flavin-dependent oxidoreductase (luciferase family)